MARDDRWRGRLLVLLILLGVLVGGSLAVDARVREQTEDQLSVAVRDQLGADQASVSIASWPFLFSIPADRIGRVHLVAADIPVDVEGRSGVVNRIEVTALGVHPLSEPAKARAEQVTGIVRMDWTQVSAVTGQHVQPAGSGRVAVDQRVEILGASLPVVLEVSVGVQADGTLTLSEATLGGAGVEISAELIDRLLDALAGQMQLPTAPGLAYTGLEVTDQGLRAELSGGDVLLSQLG